jgi:hypothetical protein
MTERCHLIRLPIGCKHFQNQMKNGKIDRYSFDFVAKGYLTFGVDYTNTLRQSSK